MPAVGQAAPDFTLPDQDGKTHGLKDYAGYHLPFPLLADDVGDVAERYGVLRNMLLFKFARRYTFLIEQQGKVRKVYDKVETSRHSKAIIADLKILTSATN